MPFMTHTYASSLVLITGVTGHIGFRVLLDALNSGYSVRAAVRSSEKAKSLSQHPKIFSIPNISSRLTFVVVPDLCRKHAYDEAARGCDFVIHIASPLMSNGVPAGSNQEDFFVKPAVRGTVNMLDAARKSGSVRRVVITSSITALIPFDELSGATRCSRWIEPTDRIPFTKGPYANEFEAYAASKVAALAEAESWIRKHDVGFDVVHLHPSFVEGRNELATSPREMFKGTNAMVLGIALGQKFEYSTMGQTVHLEDVSRVHVQSLDCANVPGNTSYILSRDMIWDDVTDIVARRFPEDVAKRMLPNSGSAVTHAVFVDTSLTEEVFGFEHVDLEEQVVSIVGYFSELRQKSGKKISLRRA
ncbi:uncharacterized protein PAC_18326 [Phialocephala subalpina]|uniref:NAD-dependent epimerase/dehydratase domain-containing protein n=1 Tax=Phialocephala subalpina TaxID=576137 RepID=A0A1L7XTY3_9HELO|nr:uncharacterized protein PAC_18326 [Phialocephala subalpina]